MPGLRVAVASGNWSSTSTWDQGIKPVVGDTVASNNYTVTIDENINVRALTNAATAISSAIPILSTNTSQLLVSSFDSTAWQAFDNNGATYNYGLLSGNTFLGYDFTTPIVINKYSISSWSTSLMPTSWSFQGWNGTSWVTLDTISGAATNSFVSSTLANTTAYTQYRILFTGGVGGYYRILEIAMYEPIYQTPAVAGGSFNLSSGVTVTTTGTTGIIPGSTTCLTYAGAGTSTVNSILGFSGSGISTLTHSGTGVLNLNGNLNNPGTSVANRHLVLLSGSGTLNYTGTNAGMQLYYAILVNGTGCTINHVGDLYGANSGGALILTGNNITANITGNFFQNNNGSIGGTVLSINGNNNIINVTGNVGNSVLTAGSLQNVITISTAATVNITGNCYGNGSGYNAVNTTAASYLKIVGGIYGGVTAPGVSSTSASAINIFTGPFVSYPSGILPFYVSRMHLLRTTNSYYEFRDNSTNGALPPAASAPATRLVSPATVVDSPAASNVRSGVVYASGTLTGTMAVPAASNVRLGVQVDNTTGTGVLSVDDIWNALRSGITTSGSIGERLKNASTVDTMASQITSIN